MICKFNQSGSKVLHPSFAALSCLLRIADSFMKPSCFLLLYVLNDCFCSGVTSPPRGIVIVVLGLCPAWVVRAIVGLPLLAMLVI